MRHNAIWTESEESVTEKAFVWCFKYTIEKYTGQSLNRLTRNGWIILNV